MKSPFQVGSISVGLSARGCTGAEVVENLMADARTAVDSGFDGVTLSEHHGGFPGYIPSPIMMTGILLDKIGGGWACAGPSVLPLRNPTVLAEDLAWMNAIHPGRVGAAFVPGYQQADFELLGVSFDDRYRLHWQGLESLMSQIGHRRDRDTALSDAAFGDLPEYGIPLLSGAAGPVGVRRAAQIGAGILIPSLRPAKEVRELTQRYVDAGGPGTVALIRRIKLEGSASGTEPGAVNVDRWRSRGKDADWLELDSGAMAQGSLEQIVDSLASQARQAGATALNVRVESYADNPESVPDELAQAGEQVVPVLRRALGWE